MHQLFDSVLITNVFGSTGTIPVNCIRFAIKRVQERIRILDHDDIDGFQPDYLESSIWRTFFSDYHATARQGNLFKKPDDMKELMDTCSELLFSIKQLLPNVANDGYKNIWIMKPAAQSRGIGITVMDNNLAMVELANRYKLNRYVVQKYLGK